MTDPLLSSSPVREGELTRTTEEDLGLPVVHIPPSENEPPERDQPATSSAPAMRRCRAAGCGAIATLGNHCEAHCMRSSPPRMDGGVVHPYYPTWIDRVKRVLAHGLATPNEVRCDVCAALEAPSVVADRAVQAERQRILAALKRAEDKGGGDATPDYYAGIGVAEWIVSGEK